MPTGTPRAADIVTVCPEMPTFIPTGKWLTDRNVTGAVLLLSGVTGIATETAVPSGTVLMGGIVPSVKPDWAGGATTFSVNIALRVNPPPVAVTVKLPETAEAFVSTRRDTVPNPLTVDPAGKLAVTPDGRPLAVSDTCWLKLLIDATFRVYSVLAPGSTVCVEGVGVIEKSGGADVPTKNGMARPCSTVCAPYVPRP